MKKKKKYLNQKDILQKAEWNPPKKGNKKELVKYKSIMQQGKGRINHFEEHIARTIKMKTFFPSTRIKRSAREFVGLRDEQEVKKKIIQRRQDFRKNRRIHPYDQCLRI